MLHTPFISCTAHVCENFGRLPLNKLNHRLATNHLTRPFALAQEEFVCLPVRSDNIYLHTSTPMAAHHGGLPGKTAATASLSSLQLPKVGACENDTPRMRA